MVSITSRVTCRFAGLSKLLFFTGLLIIAGCGKEDDITYSNTPVIGLVSISQDTIRQYEDVLSIRISYKDGDGDIGFENPISPSPSL